MIRLLKVVAALLLVAVVPVSGQTVPTLCVSDAPPVLAGHLDVTQVLMGDLDGRKIVISAGSEGTVLIRDATTLRPIGQPISGRAPIAFPSPYLLITADDESTHVWDLRRGTKAGKSLDLILGDSERLVTGQVDGVPVVVDAAYDKLRVLDVRTGEKVGRTVHGFRSPLGITTLDGVPVLVTIGERGSLSVWNLRTRRRLGKSLDLWRTEGQAQDTGPNEQAIEVSAANVLMPTYGRGVVAWDLVSRRWRTAVDMEETAEGDTSAMATYRGKDVLLRVEEQPGVGEDLDRDGHDDRSRITVWDPSTGARVTAIDVPGHVLSMAADGTRVVTGGTDNALRTFDLETGRMTSVVSGSPYDRLIRDVPAGRLAVTIRDEGGWQLLDPATETPIGDPVSPNTAVRAITADASVAVTGGGSFSHVVRVWDLKTRRQLGPPLTGFTKEISHVAVTGSLIVAAGDGVWQAAPSTLRIWDRAGHSPELPPIRLPGLVLGLGVAERHGRPVAVALGETTIWIVDLDTGTRTDLPIGGGGEVTSLAIGALNCRPVAVISRGGWAVVKDLVNGKDLRPPFDLAQRTDYVTLALRGRALVVGQGGTGRFTALFDLATGAELTS